MVKLIIGGTGSGKTKELIDQVNTAVKEEKGSVVCISRGNKLTFDISHDARLINSTDYPIKDYASLLGFLCGIRIHRQPVQDRRRQGRGTGRAVPQRSGEVLREAQRQLYDRAQRGAFRRDRGHEALPVRKGYLSGASRGPVRRSPAASRGNKSRTCPLCSGQVLLRVRRCGFPAQLTIPIGHFIIKWHMNLICFDKKQTGPPHAAGPFIGGQV